MSVWPPPLSPADFEKTTFDEAMKTLEQMQAPKSLPDWKDVKPVQRKSWQLSRSLQPL